MEDDEGDNKDSAIDTKSVFDLYANILNPREADKDVGDTASIFSGTIGKKVGNTDKST